MRKYIFLLLLISFVSCSFTKGSVDNKTIEDAKEKITSYTDEEIKRAKNEIVSTVSNVISKADTNLTKRFQQVELSLKDKAEETKEELSGKISDIDDRITKAMVFSWIGIIVGIMGVILAVLACRKKPRTNVKRVIEIIEGEIKKNPKVEETVRRISNSSSINCSQANGLQMADVERMIREYVSSKEFKDIVMQYCEASVVSVEEYKNSVEGEILDMATTKNTYHKFAKESATGTLSNLQDIYQRGKSIYKLTMQEPNATTAEVSICIEQEEVRQRILKLDRKYLEPICNVTRLSDEPTEVIIKSNGEAERIGEEWKVTKQIIVEIK